MKIAFELQLEVWFFCSSLCISLLTCAYFINLLPPHPCNAYVIMVLMYFTGSIWCFSPSGRKQCSGLLEYDQGYKMQRCTSFIEFYWGKDTRREPTPLLNSIIPDISPYLIRQITLLNESCQSLRRDIIDEIVANVVYNIRLDHKVSKARDFGPAYC